MWCDNAANGAAQNMKLVTDDIVKAGYTWTFACMSGASKLAVAGAAALAMAATY